MLVSVSKFQIRDHCSLLQHLTKCNFFLISSGGMPDIMYYTGRRYYSGIIGCISEIVLGGELKLSLDPETLGLAHNVEPGYF